jgi:hypothetical protein
LPRFGEALVDIPVSISVFPYRPAGGEFCRQRTSGNAPLRDHRKTIQDQASKCALQIPRGNHPPFRKFSIAECKQMRVLGP